MQMVDSVLNLVRLTQAHVMLAAVDVQSILDGAESADTSSFADVNNKVANTGYGIYSILGTVAVLVFLIVGGYSFLKGFILGTQQERAEFKSGMFFKLLMIVGFFALAGAIVLFANMGKNLF